MIINNMKTYLIFKNRLQLHSGPSLKKSTPAPLLFSKFVKTPPESTTPTHRVLYTSGNLCKIWTGNKQKRSEKY